MSFQRFTPFPIGAAARRKDVEVRGVRIPAFTWETGSGWSAAVPVADYPHGHGIPVADVNSYVSEWRALEELRLELDEEWTDEGLAAIASAWAGVAEEASA